MEITKTIDDKEWGFKFTLLTLKKFCEYKNIEVDKFDEFIRANFVDAMNTLLRAAIDVHSKGEKLLNEYEMDELIEKMTQEELTDIYKCYQDSLEGWVNKLILTPAKPKKK